MRGGVQRGLRGGLGAVRGGGGGIACILVACMSMVGVGWLPGICITSVVCAVCCCPTACRCHLPALPLQVKALLAEIAAAEHEAQQLEAQHQHLKRQQAALQVCVWGARLRVGERGGGCGVTLVVCGSLCPGWSWVVAILTPTLVPPLLPAFLWPPPLPTAPHTPTTTTAAAGAHHAAGGAVPHQA